jgi:effector-binding domain-containing protein
MRFLKMTGLTLLMAILITIIISLVLPAKQTIKKTIVIRSSVSAVYDHIRSLRNVNSWAVWNKYDSTIKNTFSGEDGKIGSGMSWNGDPNSSGDGKVTVNMLNENKKIRHTFSFQSPKKTEAESSFTLTEQSGGTVLTWEFEIATPRPKNVFNLFSSIDKTLGKEMEEGLLSLKEILEKQNGTKEEKIYKINQVNFAATTYALIRQKIRWEDLSPFYAAHFPMIFTDAQKAGNPPGVPTGLFYEWDQVNQMGDVAAAIPVAANSKFENALIQVQELPASKALSVDYFGDYTRSQDAYLSMDKYIAEKGLKKKLPTIEQYLNDPQVETDTAKWHTRIIYMVE